MLQPPISRTQNIKRQKYNPNALTAAHASIPVGTHVKVTNIENGKSVVVVINDHLSAHAGGEIIIDISRRACKELGFGRGLAKSPGDNLGLIPANSAGAIFDLRTDPENVSLLISNDSQKSERSTMD
jgi:rare lipoprotein A